MHLFLLHLTLSYVTILYLTLPYLTLPYLTLPYLTVAGDSILKAVLRFKELYGHFKIPVDFTIPDKDGRPAIRKSTIPPLFEPGEVEDLTSYPVTWPKKRILDLPFELWPEEVRGMKLGFKFHSIYYDKAGTALKPVLEKMGAFLNKEAPPSIYSRSAAYGTALQALKEFKANYGHLNVPMHFVIPTSGDDNVVYVNFNDNYSSSGSSSSSSSSRLGLDDSETDLMDDDSDSLSGNDEDEDEDDLSDNESNNASKDRSSNTDPSIDAGHVDGIIPTKGKRNAVIQWSTRLEGYKLGLKVEDLRFKAKYLAQNRAELDDLGFDWRPSVRQVRTKKN